MEADRESGADFRVNVKSKKHVREQLEKYKDLFKKLLDGQCHISEEDKAKLLQEMVVNFEFTVQENLVIGGLSWDEVSEEYCEDYDSTINDILDEKIVETACKRNSYPKQIRNQVVRSLRAERKLLVRHVYFHTHTHTHIYIYIYIYIWISIHSFIYTYSINKSQTNEVFNY
uniref:NSL1 component of MIS12 kinetochore complex n=1 Tax=Cyprinus carpio TaxID=7962 RepID=A0A8C1NLM2_CYPCA